jgi:type II secretory pathway pseudopilin PulG
MSAHDARGLSLAEVLVATCVLSVGLVAILTGLQYATASVHLGRAETAAVLLAEARLERLRSVGLADWGDPHLAPGTTREDYRTIAGAEGFRRETTVANRGGPGCADAAPTTVTCKMVRVTVCYRGASGGERRVELATVLAPRP